MAANDGTLVMEGATLIFKNFAGKEGQYNAEGDRNFGLLLDDNTADQLARDGWPVKHLKAREEGDTPQAWIPVSLKYHGRNGYKPRPPIVVQITSKGRQSLDEDLVDLIDLADIKSVDIMVRPYQWAVNGKTGIKAYLQELYVTLNESYLQLKYADVPELGAGDEQLAIGTGEDGVWEGEVVYDDEGRSAKAIER